MRRNAVVLWSLTAAEGINWRISCLFDERISRPISAEIDGSRATGEPREENTPQKRRGGIAG